MSDHIENSLLSVVIPLYNRRHSVENTLSSLLQNGHPDVEVIVVDDGSTDGSDEVVEKVMNTIPGGKVVKLVRQQNAGPGAARNHGARVAKSDWVAFLDSDDLWMPWTCQTLKATLKEKPDLQAMLLQIRTFTDPTSVLDWTQDPLDIITHTSLLDMRVSAERLAIYGSCNLAMRRDVFLSQGGFTDQIRSGEDTDFMYKAGAIGPVATIRAPVLAAYYDGGKDSLSRNMKNVLTGARFLINQERTGKYDGAGDRETRRSALNDSMFYTINRFFRLGYPSLAYRLLLRALPLFASAGEHGRAARLSLTPILYLIKPKRYQFRLFPQSNELPESNEKKL